MKAWKVTVAIKNRLPVTAELFHSTPIFPRAVALTYIVQAETAGAALDVTESAVTANFPASVGWELTSQQVDHATSSDIGLREWEMWDEKELRNVEDD